MGRFRGLSKVKYNPVRKRSAAFGDEAMATAAITQFRKSLASVPPQAAETRGKLAMLMTMHSSSLQQYHNRVLSCSSAALHRSRPQARLPAHLLLHHHPAPHNASAFMSTCAATLPAASLHTHAHTHTHTPTHIPTHALHHAYTRRIDHYVQQPQQPTAPATTTASPPVPAVPPPPSAPPPPPPAAPRRRRAPPAPPPRH